MVLRCCSYSGRLAGVPWVSWAVVSQALVRFLWCARIFDRLRCDFF